MKMDDSIVRNISKDTLKIVLEKLNPDFIEELPLSPEELLQYAQRRISPVISSNISYALGESMLAHRMTDEEYLIAFFRGIHASFFERKPSENSTASASILIAQTGAGKTNLKKIMPNESNHVIINSDIFKKFNPNLDKILQEDPTHLGALTGIDSYDHCNNVKNLALANNYNLLFECAPSETALLGVDLDKLDEYNYDISYHVLAVGDLISSLAIHSRYEEEIIKKGSAGEVKLTDLARHDESYRGVRNVLMNLESDKVNIYRRGTIEEGFVPQILQKPAPGSDGILPNEEIVRILDRQREYSNRQYVFGGLSNNFKEDFYRIQNYMEARNAPQNQFDQLKQIQDKYLLYLSNTKQMEEI